MNWDQISSFVNEGGTVGQHTSTHLHLPLNDKETIKSDILKSHKSFIKHLGFIPKLFAYPYGETSKQVIDVLREFGIDHSFGQHSGVIDINKNKFELPRFPINEKYGEIKRFSSLTKTLPFKFKKVYPEEKYLLQDKNPPEVKIEFYEHIKNLKSLFKLILETKTKKVVLTKTK